MSQSSLEFDPVQVAAAFVDASPIKAVRALLQQGAAGSRRAFEAGADATALVTARARQVDAVIVQAWHQQLATAPGVALVAVGGYGRAELHPGSDIDIMILLPDGDDSRLHTAIESFIAFLWDIGLEVGHSVRTLESCVSEALADITVMTNLLESRLLAGPQPLYAAIRERMSQQHLWPSRAFFEAKWQEQIQRHHKFHDTAYNLEPNIKEGPGGLRDIQMIGWVAKRHFGATTLHDLVAHGFLTQHEYDELIEGQSFLWRVRFALHTLAGRREDRLLFDYQRTLAQQFGYTDSNANLAVEQFMKRYYQTIMELSRLNEMLLQLFQEALLYADDPGEPIPLNKRFQTRKGFLEVAHEHIFRRYPFALLEIFLLLQQHPDIKGVRATTIRLIRSHRHLVDEDFRNDLRNRSLFMEILRQPQGLTHALRRMNRYGILARYLPPFGKIVGLMQYDLFHVYTADEHTLMVIRNLRRLTVAEFSHELPFCSELIRTIPKPEVLYLGALFHDIAKGRGGDHSELGAEEAEAFCRHHGMSEYDTRFVSWLVRHHLVMSTTAQRKDISDPDVITEFAGKVGDQTHLDYIYLLTVADIRGTNPSLWNSWKDALLFELYAATKRALRRGLGNPIDLWERIAETQLHARELLETEGVDMKRVSNLWSFLGIDYFQRHTADEIAWQTRTVLLNPDHELPLVAVQQRTRRGGTEIFIHTRHQDHLFAATTRALDQMGLTVVDARVIKSDNDYTFDTYVVLEESGAAISSEHRIQDILTHLRRDLARPYEATPNINRRTPRKLKHFNTPTQINFSQDLRRQRTMLELVTGDRPGLLSRVGRALMECEVYLQTAKIATIGERAEDVFYITDRNNQPVRDQASFDCLSECIHRYLDEQG